MALFLMLAAHILMGTRDGYAQGENTPSPLKEPTPSQTENIKSKKVSSLFEKGLMAYDNMHYPQAISFFNAILDAEPNNFMAMRYLGDTYSQLGKTQEAQKWLLLALKTKKWDIPNDDQYHTKYIW